MPAKKAHIPFRLRTAPRVYDDSTAVIILNSGSRSIGLGMRLSDEHAGLSATLTPTMARELARDLIERADELDPPSPEAATESTVHLVPRAGQRVSPCCARDALTLPTGDRVTSDEAEVTCKGANR